MEKDELKNKFRKFWIPLIYKGNKISFPWTDFGFSKEYSHIVNDGSYKLLKKKMKNLLYLLNKDYEKIIKLDFEKEIWYMI